MSWIGVQKWAVALALAPALTWAQAPGVVAVVRSGGAGASAQEGVVEAVRQTTVAAQVAGAVVAIDVKEGDAVKAGQVLLRLDAQAAEQNAAAANAQVAAAKATLEAASREFARQRELHEQRFISRAALDRAEADYKTAQAAAQAHLASAGIAKTQSAFYRVRAPYSGIVAQVPVVLGDMALPGRALVQIYDPAALRVAVPVPQTLARRLVPNSKVQVEIPGAGVARAIPKRMQLLPTVDAATHTQELRLDLPPDLAGAVPGMFARAWFEGGGDQESRLLVPRKAVIQRAELRAVYVLGADGKAKLRQVRLGRSEGATVEVLSGLSEGERILPDAALAKP